MGSIATAIAPIIELQTLDRLHSPLLRSDLQLQGAQSCAAASCHGGPHPGVAQAWNRRGSEYPLWLENDPHARSWRTICSDESVAMMQRLGIMQGNKIVNQEGFDNCLACHNTTKRFDETRTVSERKEGVGCAGCHGPEQLWLGTHYQFGFDTTHSTEQGFVNNDDLLTRARMCASCHVGDNDRDMNHDIIAAGHPALRYEFATYHAFQPKHWRDESAQDASYYEPQLWLAGQIASLDAAMSQLITRSQSQHTVSQWPELASFDCSSCHHALGLSNVRGDRLTSLSTLTHSESHQAVAPLAQWHQAGLRWLVDFRIARGEGTIEDEQLVAALDHVEQVMQSATHPDPSTAATAAQTVRLAINRWVDGVPGQAERQRFRSQRLGEVAAFATGQTRSFDTWESTVQLYLATVAARASWPGGPSGPLHEIAQSLRRGLGYPEQVASPEFAMRQSATNRYTRAEARRDMILLVGMLGPVELDGEAPLEDQPDAEAMQQQFEDMIEQFHQLRGHNDRAVPSKNEPPMNEATKPKPTEPSKPEESSEPREPMKSVGPDKPSTPAERKMTPEEILKRLQEMRQEQLKKK